MDPTLETLTTRRSRGEINRQRPDKIKALDKSRQKPF